MSSGYKTSTNILSVISQTMSDRSLLELVCAVSVFRGSKFPNIVRPITHLIFRTLFCTFVFSFWLTLLYSLIPRIHFNKTHMIDTRGRKCCNRRGRVVLSNYDIFIYVVQSSETSLPWYAKGGNWRSIAIVQDTKKTTAN